MHTLIVNPKDAIKAQNLIDEKDSLNENLIEYPLDNTRWDIKNEQTEENIRYYFAMFNIEYKIE